MYSWYGYYIRLHDPADISSIDLRAHTAGCATRAALAILKVASASQLNSREVPVDVDARTIIGTLASFQDRSHRGQYAVHTLVRAWRRCRLRVAGHPVSDRAVPIPEHRIRERRMIS